MSFSPRIDNLESNLIFNGNMDFAQRVGTLGSQSTNSVTNTFTLDRWLTSGYAGSNTSNFTVAQVADVPTQAQSGFASVYSLKLTTTNSAVQAGTSLSYRMEGYDYQRLHARKMRLQFWVKVAGTGVTGTYSLSLRNNGATRSYVTTYTIGSANTWLPITLDLPLDNAGSWSFDNTKGLEIGWALGLGSGANQTSTLNQWTSSANAISTTQTDWAAGNGNIFQIANVMLIPQDLAQATASNIVVPFLRHGKNISEELRACQRYYQKSMFLSVAAANNFGPNNGTFGFTIAKSGVTQYVVFVPYMVNVRAPGGSPSPTFYNPSANNAQARNFGTGTDSTSLNGNGFITNGDNGFSIALSQPAGWSAGDNCGFGWSIDTEI